MINSKVTKQAVQQTAEDKLFKVLESIDWKLWEIYNKLPYITQLNYNATLKLDDRTWGATNPGVWTHHLQSLMSKDKYTHWDQYTQDTTL